MLLHQGKNKTSLNWFQGLQRVINLNLQVITGSGTMANLIVIENATLSDY